MKTKLKSMFKFIAFLAFVVFVCLMLLVIPGAVTKVASWTNTSASALKNVLVTAVGVGIGAMLISFGVSALAVPVVGIVLIAIGVIVLGYSLWRSGWFSSSGGQVPIDDKSKLQKVA